MRERGVNHMTDNQEGERVIMIVTTQVVSLVDVAGTEGEEVGGGGKERKEREGG